MSNRTPAAAALVTLFLTGCASQPSGEPAAAYGGALLYNCPMGNADSDGNGYPDACDKLLWSDSATPRTYSIQPTTKWDPTSRAELVMYTTPGVIEGTGAEAGGYNSKTGVFEDVNDVSDFPADLAGNPNPNPQRGADWIASNPLADSVWLQPRVGDMNLDGVSVPLAELKGKHVSHFVRTITGYGYDEATNTLAFRGGWQVFGY